MVDHPRHRIGLIHTRRTFRQVKRVGRVLVHNEKMGAGNHLDLFVRIEIGGAADSDAMRLLFRRNATIDAYFGITRLRVDDDILLARAKCHEQQGERK